MGRLLPIGTENKKGRLGAYPWNEPDVSAGVHLDRDYLGHNIAAIAVDGEGHVVDFEFNHNRLFNSSAEHAEARLVRRVFDLAQVADAWNAIQTGSEALGHSPKDDYTMLSEVTVYTSLESCSPCAGTMALGRVKEVVYLQTDPGMYFIGRILRNLTSDELRAPLPIAGAQIRLPYFSELDQSFGEFKRQVVDTPFWQSPDNSERDTKGSVTSFLCTKVARDIYGRAADRFHSLASGADALEHPRFQPSGRSGATARTALTNEAALAEANDFLEYARGSGRRATRKVQRCSGGLPRPGGVRPISPITPRAAAAPRATPASPPPPAPAALPRPTRSRRPPPQPANGPPPSPMD